jgi:hypothetical protein
MFTELALVRSGWAEHAERVSTKKFCSAMTVLCCAPNGNAAAMPHQNDPHVHICSAMANAVTHFQSVRG